jgi:hypothetical protein
MEQGLCKRARGFTLARGPTVIPDHGLRAVDHVEVPVRQRKQVTLALILIAPPWREVPGREERLQRSQVEDAPSAYLWRPGVGSTA